MALDNKSKIDLALRIELSKNDIPKSLRKLNAVKKLSEKLKYRFDEVLFNISICNNKVGKADKAIYFLEKCIELQKDHTDKRKLAHTLSYYGAVLTNLGNYEKAIESLYSAQTIQSKSKDWLALVYTYIRIGNIHRSFLNDLEKALHVNKKALKLSRHLKDNYLIGCCLGSIANVYLYKGDYSNADKFYDESSKIFEVMGNDHQYCIALLGLGTSNRSLGRNTSSISYLKKALTILQRTKNLSLETSISLNLAITYLAANDEKSAQHYYKKSMLMIKKIGNKTLESTLYQGFAEEYAKKKDYENAYKHHINHYRLYTGIFKEESERMNKILRLKYEKQQSEKEAEIYKLKSLELKREVDSKTKELNAMATYLSQKNEFVNNLIENIKKDFLEFKFERKLGDYLGTAVKKAESASNLNKDFKRFESELDKFNFDFIESLSRKYPGLTRVELKICSMMKINLSTKEIANLLYLSTRTVESHKYNIYKKIKLKANQNIVTFLNSI